jgi:hypothetical protein
MYTGAVMLIISVSMTDIMTVTSIIVLVLVCISLIVVDMIGFGIKTVLGVNLRRIR